MFYIILMKTLQEFNYSTALKSQEVILFLKYISSLSDYQICYTSAWHFTFNTFICTKESRQVFEMVISILPGRPGQIHS